MPDKFFIDSNILIYAYSIDEPKKQKIVNKILSEDMHHLHLIKNTLKIVNPFL